MLLDLAIEKVLQLYLQFQSLFRHDVGSIGRLDAKTVSGEQHARQRISFNDSQNYDIVVAAPLRAAVHHQVHNNPFR